MWQGTVEPAIVSWLGADRRFIRHRLIRCFGAGESPIEKMLPDLIRRGRVPTVGITASKATITLRITAEGPTPEACYEAIEPTVATIRECLGELVFGEGDDELHDVVVRMLREKRQTLATVECGSGGILAEYLSEADPEMKIYLGGMVARHQNVRGQMAGIEQSRAKQCSETNARLPGPDLGEIQHSTRFEQCKQYQRPLSEENLEGKAIVQAMALGCREEYDSDYALALGPFPRGDDDASPPGKVHFALAGPEGVATKSSLFAAHPDIRTPLAVKQALNLLRLTLMK
jgi:nicotinamide-nucleotide amidase